MFARLGWSLYAGEQVPDSLSKPWKRIVAAAGEALKLLSTRIPRQRTLLGYEVDKAARARLGGSPDILPRPLGYNLNRDQNNFGVRFDNYLTRDDREIMPGMGFTLQPGIYTDTHALRTCVNLFITGDREVSLSAPLQQEIIAVLAPPAGADSLRASSR
jgi:Xaa-Pro aminopeptidase